VEHVGLEPTKRYFRYVTPRHIYSKFQHTNAVSLDAP